MKSAGFGRSLFIPNIDLARRILTDNYDGQTGLYPSFLQ
jgi:hypothetical protein